MTNPSSSHEDLGILLAMLYMAWSDRALSQDELKLVAQEVGDQGLSKQETKILADAVVEGQPTLEDIKKYLSSEEARKAAITAACLVAYSDKAIRFEELDAFDELCVALNITDEEKMEIKDYADRCFRLVKEADVESLSLIKLFEGIEE